MGARRLLRPRRADCDRSKDRSKIMALRRVTGFLSAIVCVARCRACSGQLYWMAVRRVEVGTTPFLLTLQLVAWVGNAQCGDDPLKRSEELPMIGSIRILAGLLRTGGDLCAENLYPLVPLELA